MQPIPVHLLQDRTTLGVQLKRFEKGDLPEDDEALLGAHRDDHYIFFLLEQGSGFLMIDFKEIRLSGSMLYYILPSQVHHRIHNEQVDGWFIAVDTALIPSECRSVFEGGLLLQEPYVLSEVQLSKVHNLLTLLQETFYQEHANSFYIPVIHALLQSFLFIAAGCYNGSLVASLKVSRPAELTRAFKNLLVKELRSNKSPADYASKLNVSESYLSESLKKTTGFPVSYWIQQEVMMEAKRLLYYSELTVKEIAHILGYIDHSYFSRLFRKVTGS
ncbi:MAG: AraC family transcriptional regulator, partial [Sphingobacteriaceae bacterium]